MKVATAFNMADIDNKTIMHVGIPSIILMENAANAVVRCLMQALVMNYDRRVLVVCGRGNNGGDGLAVARLLFHMGVDVSILFVGDRDKAFGDAKINLDIVLALNIPIVFADFNNLQCTFELIEKSSVIIDAIFGTGLNGNIEGVAQDVICRINDSSCYCICVDVPSGINSDNGKIMGVCVHAHITVTFTLIKKGLLLFPAALHAGEIVIADIGIPSHIIAAQNIMCNVLHSSEIALMLPKRRVRTNKGSFGTVYVIAGSDSMSGACFLSCSACYKSGAGIVNALSTDLVVNIIKNLIPQALTTVLPDYLGKLCNESFDCIKPFFNKANVIILGPGIGVGLEVCQFVFSIIREATCPIIIDADGLNAIAENVDILYELNAPCIVTPHPKEMSRLTGLDVEYILDNIIDTALLFAHKFNVIVLLKDSHSIIAAPDGSVYINTTGNTGLAKAGSGDILTGIIGGLIACGASAFDAAVLGAYILGVASELASESLGEYGVMADDILDKIPVVMKNSTV